MFLVGSVGRSEITNLITKMWVDENKLKRQMKRGRDVKILRKIKPTFEKSSSSQKRY